MAKDVMDVAAEAKEMAMKALAQQDTHEAVCAERYKGISGQLADLTGVKLPSVFRTIGELKGSVNRAVGAMIGLSVLSTLLAVLLTLIKIAE